MLQADARHFQNRDYVSLWNDYQTVAIKLAMELGVDVHVIRSDSMRLKFHVMGRVAGDADELRRLVTLIKKIKNE